MAALYRIDCLPEKRLYIGMTHDYSTRIGQHFYALRKGEHINRKLQKDYNRLGEEA
jgi:predicted GIY-YIG superfamily endonuclease